MLFYCDIGDAELFALWNAFDNVDQDYIGQFF